MIEHAVYSLTNRIAGKGVPPSTLVRFDVKRSGKEIYYPVLVSQTVEGTPLKEVAKGPFDNRHLTHLQLLGLITRPGDGRASNFVVRGGVIYSVDNDVSFGEPIVQEGWSKVIYFKSILYCLDENLLDQETLDEWKALAPELILQGWIDELIEREQAYLSLFKEAEIGNLFKGSQKFTPFFALRDGTITTLYTQFVKLQHALREGTPKNGRDLLNLLITLRGEAKEAQSLGSRLYNYYTDAYSAKSTPHRSSLTSCGSKN